ncbi:hypothetical protein ACLBQX_22010, partial [Klebsiella pneumoniae]
MRYKLFAVLLPCALALSACTTVTPAYKDNGTRSGPCVEGGPDARRMGRNIDSIPAETLRT